jgi:transposase
MNGRSSLSSPYPSTSSGRTDWKGSLRQASFDRLRTEQGERIEKHDFDKRSGQAERIDWKTCPISVRADAVRGKTWGVRGQTPGGRPGQRQSVSAASAINSKGAFWFETYQGALTGELFVQLLKNMMAERERPVYWVIDGLPAHKKALVRQYVAQTKGRLTLHFLPGYAPDLNPDELVWSHARRTGRAQSLAQGRETQGARGRTTAVGG